MVLNLELNPLRFKTLLRKLIGETECLQNNPPDGLVPKENLVVDHVLNALNPHLAINDGSLVHEHLVYDENQERGNLIIGYVPHDWRKGDPAVTFIGSHMDVVPADPNKWTVPPFQLSVDGDTLYGRGTTDCLGHVALLTDLFIQLDEKRPTFDRAVWAVLICSEEYTTPGIGVDRLEEEGKLERCRNGPCYWIDSSERQACVGTASSITFNLVAHGFTAHSGLPNQGINSIELASAAMKFLQEKFYTEYPPAPEEEEYGFICPSSMKPTQQVATTGSINQIPDTAQLNGDIRLTPFYNKEICMIKMKAYAAMINHDPTILPTSGPSSFILTDECGEVTRKGRIDLTFPGEKLTGIACDLDSDGYHFLDAAVTAVVGESKPYAITGSLPLVGDLQQDGYDIQITGFGFDAYYHADDERCSLDWMQDGMKIISHILDNYVQSSTVASAKVTPCCS